MGALELFEAKPQYPLTGLSPYKSREGLYKLLDSLDWVNSPWGQSHQGAGIYGAMVLSETVGLDWQDWYFQWLNTNADPITGLWRKNSIYNDNFKEKGAPIFHHLASSFHYIFNHEYAKGQYRILIKQWRLALKCTERISVCPLVRKFLLMK